MLSPSLPDVILVVYQRSSLAREGILGGASIYGSTPYIGARVKTKCFRHFENVDDGGRFGTLADGLCATFPAEKAGSMHRSEISRLRSPVPRACVHQNVRRHWVRPDVLPPDGAHATF